MGSCLCSFWKNSCLVLWSGRAMSCNELSFSSLGDTCADLVPLLTREELCLTSWFLQRCHLKSRPVPWGPGEAFLPSAQHTEAIWSSVAGFSAALELLQWFFPASGLAGGLGCGAEPAPLPQHGSQDQEPRCRARATAYFGKKLVLKQAKLLDFTAAIRPA